MYSPMKNNKKVRKPSTFSQTAAPSEVGEFKQGYFVMPDPMVSKENESPSKYKNSTQRSPTRRPKATNSESLTLSPFKERGAPKTEELKKFSTPFSEISKVPKSPGKPELMTPGNIMSSTTKNMKLMSPQSFDTSVNVSTPTKAVKLMSPQSFDTFVKSPKEGLSTSPPASGRWAGPAFGNAPPPSALPLPEFPPMMSSNNFSSSPPPVIYSSSPSYHPAQDTSSVPTQSPFPYVGYIPPPMNPLSLAQLSTDLRRMLNINEAPSLINGSILVSAHSS